MDSLQEDEEEEIPPYFLCPISLQIMTDPVTAPTGITYDRSSIERWICTAGKNKATCPSRNLPLPLDLDQLTPNHTLRRLIQSWSTARGFDRILSTLPLITTAAAADLLAELSFPEKQFNSLKKMYALISDSESNRRCMLDAGAAEVAISLLIFCYRRKQTDIIEEAITVLRALRIPSEELKPLTGENHDLVDALTWVLHHCAANKMNLMRSTAVLFLKSVFEVADQKLFERLKLEFFEMIVSVIRDRISQKTTKAAVISLLAPCPWGRNRTKIVEAGALPELIELELDSSTTTANKRLTELIFAVLDYLCSCADGRAQLIGHPAGIALISKRILRVSSVVDEKGVRILSSVSKFSATYELLQEMLMVGAVSKLCLVLQADCSSSVKDRARLVLRLHSAVWKSSPCINVCLLSRYP